MYIFNGTTFKIVERNKELVIEKESGKLDNFERELFIEKFSNGKIIVDRFIHDIINGNNTKKSNDKYIIYCHNCNKEINVYDGIKILYEYGETGYKCICGKIYIDPATIPKAAIEHSKNVDEKCKFYKDDKCSNHCNMSDTHLWEHANDPDENNGEIVWNCDRKSELFYYNDDTGQNEYIETSIVDNKLYYSHATQDYNSEYEMNCLEKINELYSNYEIINPKDIIIPDEDKEKLKGNYNNFISKMEKHFFPLINKCNLLIVSKNKLGNLYGGVKKEIKYAEKNGIKVEYLNIPYPNPNRETVNCYYCGKQIIKEEDTYMKDNDNIYRDCCYYCNGINPCFDCKNKECTKNNGYILPQNIEKNKCQAQNH